LARACELVTPVVCLDVVKADDGVGIGLEEALGCRQAAFERPRVGSRDFDCVEIELGREFLAPLRHEVGRTDHGEAIDLPAIEHLAHDHASLDRLADADVVGDQQALHLELQCHEEWNELIGARFDTELGRAPEGAGTAAHGKTQRVGEQSGAVLIVDRVSSGRRER
jgi:hypothetical protein